MADETAETQTRLKPEHVAALLGGGLPMASFLSQGGNPALKHTPNITTKDIQRLARAGDVLLTRSDHPGSGFRMAGTALTGTPYYHGEMIFKNRAGKLRAATSSNNMASTIRDVLNGDQESAVLMRLRKLPKINHKLMRNAAENLYSGGYGDMKSVLIGGSRLLAPDSELSGKIPKKLLEMCKGDVCTTGPATVLRASGIDPKLRAPAGYELAGDYMRSKHWKPVATWGKVHSDNYRLTTALPARVALAAGLGGAAYKTTKDIREGDRTSLPAGIAGAVAGGLAGKALDETAMSALTSGEVEKSLTRRLRQLGLGAKRSGPLASYATRGLSGIAAHNTLLPSILGALGGGLGAYLLARKLRNQDKETKPAQ